MFAYVANTNVLELIGLKSAIEDAYVNDATVSVTVKDSSGSNVSGQSWPTTMTYVTDSNGNYRAILKDVAVLQARKNYTAVVSVNAGSDRIGHWEFEFTAVTRT